MVTHLNSPTLLDFIEIIEDIYVMEKLTFSLMLQVKQIPVILGQMVRVP